MFRAKTVNSGWAGATAAPAGFNLQSPMGIPESVHRAG
jgi:hypothetical protein